MNEGRRQAADPVAGAPVQEPLDGAASFKVKDYTLTPRATYRMEGKLLSKRRYRFAAHAGLVPWDFAMGWDGMSREETLSQLKIEQSNRFYFYAWEGTPPIPVPEIVRSSANMHLIPANDTVSRALGRARPGDAVSLNGRLVDLADGKGGTLSTSLTREDSGPGACEVMWVEDVTIRTP